MAAPYNHKQCQSLFGYSFDVHIRSGATCQLCGCGGESLTFDLWRQMTVEHIIGKSQGGYLKEIRLAVAECFPNLSASARESLSKEIDAINTVTACSFCNSTTSRDSSSTSMSDLIRNSTGDPNQVLKKISSALKPILDRKRSDVAWKLESVRKAYEENFLSALNPSEHAAG
ncbi:MAG: hypothetical protein LBE81_08305 [Azonexus sp.]|jgi:hypothetical protein|uniref:hypothetical protein n=1 Tax=Azonexus sp. TaxID=1872668 RepID=UPI0028170FCA|nr:hypothetical protein [Azonexus sp.]MDR0776624.1 hypothetical protein [Azonexus sp.]